MKQLIFLVIVIFTICSCKRDPSLSPSPAVKTLSLYGNSSYCELYTTISADTNYIPHKKNNSWDFCSGSDMIAGWRAVVTQDTIINNRVSFEITYDWNTQHPMGPTHIVEKMFIDSIGNYYSNTVSDTLLLIDINAVNGDTIYNNPITHTKVVLVNNSEIIGSLSNCYHSRVLYPYPNGTTRDYYFKKGIGPVLMYSYSFKLYQATIH